MSDELEKLKSDLEKLYAAYNVTRDMNCENIALGIKSLYDVVLKEIEKQNNPFAEAKRSVNSWINDSYYDHTFERKVAMYVRYLENQISDGFEEDELEIEITCPHHKDYYCLKNSKGQMYRHLFNTVAIFSSLEEAEFVAKHITHPGFKATLYTGNN